jgi:replication-associated recombination protein RarA
MKLLTKNGHDLLDVASLLQKSIRRSDDKWAGYAVNELRGRYNNYLWKKLLIVSAEDCWGVITKEIIALREADEIFNKGKKGYDRNGEFISKATTLLLKARKNRDSDWFACNLIKSEEVLDVKAYLNIEDQGRADELPEYTYDCHTIKGKINGKTKADMIKDEQEALNPHQKGDYDENDWSSFHNSLDMIKRKNFNVDEEFPKPTRKELNALDKSEQSSNTLFG